MTETNMLRVLVAEDNALERSTLVDLLGALGHLVVAEVSTGPEAVVQARQLAPDAVLLDQHLPGASGAAAMVRLTAWVALGAVPLAACTVKLKLPDAVGVPERTPVLLLSVMPAGKAPAEIVQVIVVGTPVAVKVCPA